MKKEYIEVNRLADLRKDLDLSQAELAKQLGYYTTTYARWEHNPMQVKLQDLINLAEYHNVSLDYLAGLTNDKSKKW
ncbi:MAG: helix-turn-helix transcriptional regulator [Oscillospiraceae bacterium]|nr:helix-turn-helix transcriptional regulator [Oscillospiraceae bacterium]